MPFSAEKAEKDRKKDVSSRCTSECTLWSGNVNEDEYSKDSKSGGPSGVINTVVSVSETQIRSISNLLPRKNPSQHEHLISVPGIPRFLPRMEQINSIHLTKKFAVPKYLKQSPKYPILAR